MNADRPRICVPKRLTADLAAGAALRAIAHHPANAPEVIGRPHPLEIASVTAKRWRPGHEITVGFFGGSQATRGRVLQHMRRWSEACNIAFAADAADRAMVRVAFDPSAGSWSYIGTDVLTIPRSEPTMNLGWIDDDTPDEEVRRVVVHETGHTLSFEHEAQLGLALGSIQFNRPLVYGYFCGPPNNWSQQEVDDQVLEPLSLAGVEHSAWDRASIMQYFFERDWLIPPTDIPRTTNLSPVDIARAREWYGPPAGAAVVLAAGRPA